jgi:anti-sigma regulatory factor (Ser/Thr protein kinase)
MGLLFHEPQSFIDADVDFARKLGGTVSYALDNARLYTELSESLRAVEDRDRAIRRAYTDVIEAVTGGRLVLLGEDELDRVVPTRTVGEQLVDTEEELVEARHDVRGYLEGMPEADDLVVAFCEALTNAIKHAGGGRYGCHHTASRLQLVVSDEGPGIDFKSLPKATLLSGYSTKQSLGMGFTLMMEFSDRVLLCTDEGGTTVVLEKDL